MTTAATSKEWDVDQAPDPLARGLLAWATRAPGRPALRDSQRSLDYAQFAHAVLALATRLRRLGAGAGHVIGVACDRSVDTVVAIHAVIASGAAYLPLDLSYPHARLADMLADAQPDLVLTAAGDATLAGLGAVTLDRTCATDGDVEAAACVAADAPAYVVFTSGSTGRPKGAVVSRRALAHMIAWHVGHPRLGVSARTLQFATFGFDVSVRDVFATFATGGTLIMADDADRRDPFRLLELLARERIARMCLPYVALRAMARAHAEGGTTPAALRDVISGGEVLTVTPALRGLFAALDGAVLYNEYGPTEACVFVTSEALADDPHAWPERPGIGAALPYARLHVVDENLRPLAGEVEGELLIGGAGLADGYIGQPALTAERFIHFVDNEGCSERVYRSGDRVLRQADGSFAFVGRNDGQVKIAGVRVELEDIEVALCAHPAVCAASVVAPPGITGRFLVAHVVARRAQESDAALRGTLMRHLAARLPPQQLPHRMVLRDALPLTPNGKVDRRRLLQESTPSPVSPPRNGATLEQRVCAVWGELLGVPALEPAQSVFDAGADSLCVMAFVTRAQADGLGRLAAAAVYEHTTPRAQARLLAGMPEVPARPTDARGEGRQREVMARLRERRRSAL